tara:strand:- start:1039 stop:1434 length:396 start_codon:yes stop_codon:yes gene_type:complete
MATITAQIKILSTDLLTDELSLDTTFKMSGVLATTGLARTKVTAQAAGDSDITSLLPASGWAAPVYLYIKNTDSTATNYLFVYSSTGSNPIIAKIAGGEWAFVPYGLSIPLLVYGTAATSVMEYMIFGTEA